MESKRDSVIALYLTGKPQVNIVEALQHLNVNKSFVSRTIARYRETGSVARRQGSGRKRTATSKEMVRKVKKRIERNPCLSGRQMARELNISQYSIRQIFKNELDLNPLKFQKVQGMRKEMEEANSVEEERAIERNHGSLSNDEELMNGDEIDESQEPKKEKPAKKPTKSKQKKNKGKKKALSTAPPVIILSDGEESVSATERPDRIGLQLGRPGNGVPSDDDDDWTGGNKKSNRKGKAKGKVSDAGQKGQQNVSDDEGTGQTTEHGCVPCCEKFPSRHKLFDHLKKTGHSVYITKLKGKRKVTGLIFDKIFDLRVCFDCLVAQCFSPRWPAWNPSNAKAPALLCVTGGSK